MPARALLLVLARFLVALRQKLFGRAAREIARRSGSRTRSTTCACRWTLLDQITLALLLAPLLVALLVAHALLLAILAVEHIRRCRFLATSYVVAVRSGWVPRITRHRLKPQGRRAARNARLRVAVALQAGRLVLRCVVARDAQLVGALASWLVHWRSWLPFTRNGTSGKAFPRN